MVGLGGIGEYSSDMKSAVVYTRCPLISAVTASRGTMVECIVGLASKIVFGVWVRRASGR